MEIETTNATARLKTYLEPDLPSKSVCVRVCVCVFVMVTVLVPCLVAWALT